MNFEDYLSIDCIDASLVANTSYEAIDQLCYLLARSQGLSSKSLLSLSVRQREDVAPTVLRPKFAFPHVNSELVKKKAIVVGICRSPINWVQAIDQKVKYVFLVVGPRDEMLTDIILGLNLMFNNISTIRRLDQCQTSEEILYFMTHLGIDLDTPFGLSLDKIINTCYFEIQALAWSQEGKLASVGMGSDNGLQIWSPDKDIIENKIKHNNQIKCVAWKPGGKIIATGSDDRIIRLWNTVTHGLENEIQTYDVIHDIAFSLKGKMIATAGHIHGVRLWSYNAKLIQPHPLGYLIVPTNCVAWSPNEQVLAVAGGRLKQRIVVWNIQSDQIIHNEVLDNDPVFAIAWSPKKPMLAIGLMNGKIIIYDTEKWKSIKINAHDDAITSLAFSPTYDLLVSKSTDGLVRFWRTGDWDLVEGLIDPVSDFSYKGPLAFSENGKKLATLGGLADSIRIWRVHSELIIT